MAIFGKKINDMTHSGKNLAIVSSQILFWVAILFLPAMIDFVSHGSGERIIGVLGGTFKHVLPSVLIYFINFYWLVPRFLFRRHLPAFFLINVAILIVSHLWMFAGMFQHMQGELRPAFWSIVGVAFLFSILLIGCATGFRYIIRWNNMQMRLKEEKQRNAEAELAWLKSQLNPHFLFNTLNNISSLVQINADGAQESIGQLSDLLRYTLYDSNHDLVPVEGEIEFMHNYIDLMKLRCNELTTIRVELNVPPKPTMIVPLLFISLIENAFKHGVNSRKPSFIHISFKAQGSDLIFTCENSIHTKIESDRIGSGIGLENLRRRLELTYPGRYQYVQEVKNDIYFAQITLQNCL